MKQNLLLFVTLFTVYSFGQLEGNTSPDYTSLISMYQELAENHKEIELYSMGESDYGLPIYLCILNGASDSLQSFRKAQTGNTLLINNAIHPGEPDGVNACLIWINDWIANGKKTKDLPVIGIIPAYNVGGMMNRSSSSRANQDGPEEYGFRGNAQNLDLNRDFIKMDSKNMFTFAKIFQGLDPDVFLDTHVSNGADYQYTMTYIASVRERMAPALGNLMHDNMIPEITEEVKKKGFDLIPYVNTKGVTPETGITVFNDLPRYAMGYASLMNAISFTLETHMLKPFPQRVQSTLAFIESTINWMGENQQKIAFVRQETEYWDQNSASYLYNYTLSEDKDSILFKGYEYSEPISELTGMKRLKYHEDQPYEKFIPYYNKYYPLDTLQTPDYIVIGGQCAEVITRLKANGVQMVPVNTTDSEHVLACRIISYENGTRPYEGHFLHNKVKRELVEKEVNLKPIDLRINLNQKNARFILSVLDPASPDSYFAWNFFDSYVQQKEYFSTYVFEDKALEILENDPDLKKRFEKRKSSDQEFSESSWDQLYFIYKNSPYYEPTHNFLPIYFGYKEM